MRGLCAEYVDLAYGKVPPMLTESISEGRSYFLRYGALPGDDVVEVTHTHTGSRSHFGQRTPTKIERCFGVMGF